MKLKIYSIYDTVAQVFNKPFTDINDATAIRAFSQSVMESPHKNDYQLYNLGEYTDHDGAIVPYEPVRIYTGFDVKNNVVDLPESVKKQNV